ncbi:DNA-binding GntR family transcriptional regulator [Tamaricihabitans halophyticus]|uniref:DNA-binding GntR family transcriptional regulator n=1 Tax=Tamaricihabitans halophyticus TaxID=1262583 RepID=A0A4R2R5V1_9PSEU|nr:GntR family transcriptional regulator [Tamaricihabitans halophyticus]TCP54961.1 DNA-binding GntR family transcriptional regulator [Tamaricihabitans halophyticus]
MSGTATDRVVDGVYARLREKIFTGELAPGTKLSVPALAELLEVSRSPVRDAVLRLVQDRLATEEPRRGAVVASVGAAELVTIYEVREVLEGLAARLAVENAGRRLVRALREALDDHQHAVDVSDLAATTEADMRFHALVREASGNHEVIRLLDEIQTQVRLAMRTTTVTAGPRHALDDHRAILTAIESGDPNAAEQVARAHIFRLRAALREQAGQRR